MIKTDLPIISASQVGDAAILANRSGAIIALGGPTGGGKTTSAKEAAKANGIDPIFRHISEAHKGGIVVINCAGVHEENARGIQVPHHEGDGNYRAVSIIPEEMPVYDTVGDAHVLCVVDEYQAASGPYKQALRSAFFAPEGQERYIGVHKVGPNVKFMITFNGRIDDMENGKELAQPDAARVCQYRYELSCKDFLDYTAAKHKESPVWGYLNLYQQGVETDGEGLNPWTNTVAGEDRPSRYVGGTVCCGRTWEGLCKMFPDWDSIRNAEHFELHASSRIPNRVVRDMVNLINAVLRVGPKVTSIRNGHSTLQDIPKHEHPAIAFAAARIALNEAGKDKPAAIASGLWDWAFDLFESCSAELGAWIFSTLAAHTQPEPTKDNPTPDNPIFDHPSASKLAGLVKC